MTISGFTMVKNATKLFYPIGPSIASALPLVDEFVVALGKGDDDDTTRRAIESLNTDKVRIIDTEWDTEAFPNGTENAHQTDIAKEACTGDWCFYLQADEVVHEQYLPEIRQQCERYLDDERVEGFLFNYVHFWGDFRHYHQAHGWYPEEIRIVRNDPDIHSWRSAQSFRRIPDFDGQSYRQTEGTYKLNVVKLDACIYHYGWVRPPHLMNRKRKALDSIHKGEAAAEALHAQGADRFDYGDLSRLPVFKGTHPEVMQDWIAQFDWQSELDAPPNPERPLHKHEKTGNRLLTWVEQKLLGGRQLFTSRNWNRIA